MRCLRWNNEQVVDKGFWMVCIVLYLIPTLVSLFPRSLPSSSSTLLSRSLSHSQVFEEEKEEYKGNFAGKFTHISILLY